MYSGAPSKTKTGNFLSCKGALYLISCEKWGHMPPPPPVPTVPIYIAAEDSNLTN